MRLRFPIPVAVITSVVGLGAIAVAGAQDSPRLQPAANPESTFNVALNGINEIPDADLDGTGQATITVNTTTGLVCVNITTTNIAINNTVVERIVVRFITRLLGAMSDPWNLSNPSNLSNALNPLNPSNLSNPSNPC